MTKLGYCAFALLLMLTYFITPKLEATRVTAPNCVPGGVTMYATLRPWPDTGEIISYWPGIMPGQEFFWDVGFLVSTLHNPPYCEIHGGQLSIAQPQNSFEKLAGYPGTEQIPWVGFYTIPSSHYHVALGANYLFWDNALKCYRFQVRIDWGPTSFRPAQLPATNSLGNPIPAAALVRNLTILPRCYYYGDLNYDETVDIDDLIFLLSNWGVVPEDHMADLDHKRDANFNYNVNIDDLVLLVTRWHQCN